MPPRLGLLSSSETISISQSVSSSSATPQTPSAAATDSPTNSWRESPASSSSTSMPLSNTISNNNIRRNSSSRHYELKLYRQHSSFRFVECEGWLKHVWMIHFLAGIIAIIVGSLIASIPSSSSATATTKQKYIPIDVNAIEEDCTRAFVNVFAESFDDPGALYCCNNNSKANPMICQQPPWFLFFAGRLARFPDAWLLPLFPLFFRGFIIFFRRITKQKLLSSSRGVGGGGLHNYSGGSSSTSSPSSKSDLMYAKRRFLLYIILIQIRGWILYLLFDQIEDFFMSSTTTTTTTTTYSQQQQLQQTDESCWYSDLLLPHHHNKHNPHGSSSHNCHGRDIDFSDHMVLYYAQILPIALTEVLHSFVVPYWEIHKDRIYAGKKRHNSIIPYVLVFFMLNLYLVTFYGVYKTSVYFHTISEVVMGYLVSLCIQIPLFLLQCTTTFSPQAREWLYGYSIS